MPATVAAVHDAQPERGAGPADTCGGVCSASLKERGCVKEMVGWTCRLWVVGSCGRARVAAGAGVKAGCRPSRRGRGLDAGDERRRLELRSSRAPRPRP